MLLLSLLLLIFDDGGDRGRGDRGAAAAAAPPALICMCGGIAFGVGRAAAAKRLCVIAAHYEHAHVLFKTPAHTLLFFRGYTEFRQRRTAVRHHRYRSMTDEVPELLLNFMVVDWDEPPTLVISRRTLIAGTTAAVLLPQDIFCRNTRWHAGDVFV